MLELIRRARRRFFFNELVAQGANVFSAAVLALILLLLAGTEVLSWRWLLPLPGLAAAAGVYLARRRLPSPYRVAQAVDRRMALADTLSTAIFFGDGAFGSRVSGRMRQSQLELANRMAAGVDVRRAVPYAMPRTVYVLAALVLVASSLFALRYGLSRRLDLKPPLARILQQVLRSSPQTQEAKAARPDPPREPDLDGEESAAAPDYEQTESSGGADRENTDPSSQPEARRRADGSGRQEEQQAADDEKSGGEAEDARAEENSAGQDGDRQRSSRPGDRNAQQGRQGSAKQDPQGLGQESSLLSRVKDAVQNLLSRMKPQQSSGARQQNAMNQNGRQDKGQQSGKQRGSTGAGRQNGTEGDAGQDQSEQQAQNAAGQQGRTKGQSDAEQSGHQPGSGIGSQDGAKDIKLA
ncbi:MAG TPA: hypothetical protein VF767_03315 [Bryobacteraceae bacterium]